MNNFFKVVYATLGGFNVIFNLFVPIAIVLLWLTTFGSQGWMTTLVILLGCFATLYRGLDFLFIREDN